MSDEQMPTISLTPEQWEWLRENELVRNANANKAHRQSISASLVAAETMRAQEARYLTELRDRFAMSALIALASMKGSDDLRGGDIARAAYMIADAMMKARTDG